MNYQLFLWMSVISFAVSNGHHIDQRILEANTDVNNKTNAVEDSASEEDVPFELEHVLRNNATSGAVIDANGTASDVIALMRSSDGSEAKDLRVNTQNQRTDAIVDNHQHPMEAQEPMHFPDKIDKETELIENGENTEDELRKHDNLLSVEVEKSEIGLERTQNSLLAIILVSGFVLFSIFCYVSLIFWRRYLENRYGSRSLLVDAEELPEPNDLRHFTI